MLPQLTLHYLTTLPSTYRTLSSPTPLYFTPTHPTLHHPSPTLLYANPTLPYSSPTIPYPTLPYTIVSNLTPTQPPTYHMLPYALLYYTYPNIPYPGTSYLAAPYLNLTHSLSCSIRGRAIVKPAN